MKYNHTWLAILALFINKASAQVDVYPWPNTASQSNMYSVKLTQDDHDYFPKELLSKPQLEEGPDGNGVTGLNHDRTMTYVPFSYTDKVKVTARKLFGKPAKRVEISPKSFGIEPLSFDGRTVEFILPDNISPAYISINFITSEINDNDNVDANNNEATTIRHGLVLFADQPETNIPDINQIGAVNYVTATRNEIENADLLYFPTGDHNLIEKFGKINSKTGTDARIYLQKNNQQIYLQPGAVIRGSIDAQGHDGISVSGRGLITGADFHWHYFQGAELTKGKEAFLNFTGCDNCTFNGFIIDNPTHHTLPSSNNTTTKNIKIIGWASNQDGIRPANNSVAEQVFIKTSDDLNYARNSNQTLKDSVIWPMRNGALGMLGWNNLGTGGTIFKNLYVINAEWDIDADQKRNTGIIGSVLNQGVNQANNTVEDLYAEWGMGMLANISIIFDSNKLPSTPENNSWGVISDFTFKNILLESTFQNSGGKTLKNQIKGFEKNGAKAMIKNFTFINVVAGNTVISNDNAHLYFDIDDNTTENINFITEGKFHTLTVTSNDGGYVSPKGNIPTPEGMKRYLTIIADEGKCIESVSINGVTVGRRQNVYFDQMNQDYNVNIVFASGNDLFTQDQVCSTFEVNQSTEPFSPTTAIPIEPEQAPETNPLPEPEPIVIPEQEPTPLPEPVVEPTTEPQTETPVELVPPEEKVEISDQNSSGGSISLLFLLIMTVKRTIISSKYHLLVSQVIRSKTGNK